MKLIAWLLARPAILAGIVLCVLLSGWHFQDKISDWWDDKKITRLEGQVTALQASVSALEDAKRLQEAATKAADEARDRNDTKIPEVRAASQGRVSRAADPALPAADQLQDDRAALEGYGAAADSLRGARPR